MYHKMTPFIVLKCNKVTVHEVIPEAATRCVLQKKLFIKNLQISQENTYVGVSFLKLHIFKPAYLLKRDSRPDAFLWTLQNF